MNWEGVEAPNPRQFQPCKLLTEFLCMSSPVFCCSFV